MKNLPNQCVDAENEAVHGSCSRKPRARLSFPVTTGVRITKNHAHESVYR